MPIDPFETLKRTVSDTVATLKGDLGAEFMTTQACQETGCEPPPQPW